MSYEPYNHTTVRPFKDDELMNESIVMEFGSKCLGLFLSPSHRELSDAIYICQTQDIKTPPPTICYTQLILCITISQVLFSVHFLSCDNMRVSAEFERVLKYFDEDGDGKISPSELRNRLCMMGGELLFKDAEKLIEELVDKTERFWCF